ncbi:MAG: tetratricopeptide (TPR) repeat protein [Motiliproteus sp.]|jgi:tetratricopeptide (TPR) repeat protein
MGAILAEKSILIVAAKLDALGVLRAQVSALGAAEVQVASSANMALNMMRMQSFDICVIENYLGDGEKSGYQLIEESIHGGLKKAGHSYVLILPEGSGGMANDSLESFAESFFVKPIDPQLFASRLEKLIKLKQAIKPAEELVDLAENTKALLLTTQLLRKHPSLVTYLTRLQGRLLLTLENYTDAVPLFERIAADRGSSWAYLGLGICAYNQGQYADAIAHFHLVLQRTPDSIEAFEWLSKVYRALGRNDEAQKLLERAVKLQPTAPVLHYGLGNVASENSNWTVAIVAFRNAVKFALHSCHQQRHNYFGLARCLQTQVSAQGGANSSKAEQEAIRTLESVVFEYHQDQRIRFKSRLMTSETYRLSGDITRANVAAKDAFEVYKTLGDSTKAEELDNLLEGVEGTLLQSSVEAYKADFSRRVFTETEWGRNNFKGMSLYRKGRFDEALACFLKALETVPNSPNVLLNLIQTGYGLIQQHPQRAAEVLSVCNEKLLSVSIGAMNNKQQERFRALSFRRAQLARIEGDAEGDA